MSVLPKDLYGKEIVPRTAKLNFELHCGLWADFSHWLPLSEQTNRWYDNSILEQHNVVIDVMLDNEVIFTKKFNCFETVLFSHELDDAESASMELSIVIRNLSSLPSRDDTGMFVAGMIEIKSISIQNIEVLNLLESTFFGNDTSITLSIRTPIYSWLVENYSRILPGVFN